MPEFEEGMEEFSTDGQQYSTIALSRITGHSVVTQPIRRCLRHPTRESSSSSGFREYLQPFFLMICAVGQICQRPQPHAGRVSGLQRADRTTCLVPRFSSLSAQKLTLRLSRMTRCFVGMGAFFSVFLSPAWSPCLVRGLVRVLVRVRARKTRLCFKRPTSLARSISRAY
ncbi:hypothetical protein GB937_001789 [Aspergillus fischeri]|nr:hypothetical protein GB937_001789 [Aspergillus fischeri]